MPDSIQSQLPWVSLFAPLAAAALIALGARSLPGLSALLSVLASGASFAAACALFAAPPGPGPAPIPWLRFGPGLDVSLGVSLDPWSLPVLIVVTGVALLIHVYSLGYMAGDDARPRYFAGLSLFLGSMVGVVLADNLVALFAF